MIEYRPYHVSDEAPCLDLMLHCVDCFEGVGEGACPKLREHFRRKFSGEFLTSVFCLVAAADDRIVGMGVLDGTEVRRMYVAPDLQRQGIGRALYDRLEAEARRQGLASLQLHASINAVAFYESLGFVSASEQTWYLDGLAIRNKLMTKDLQCH